MTRKGPTMRQTRTHFRTPTLLLVFLATLVGCTSEDADDGAGPDRPLVTMRGKTITTAQFDTELATVSPFAQTQFSGKEGRRRMLDRMLQNELLYRAAVDKGYRASKAVREQLEEYERNLLIREYYRTEIQGRVDVSDAAVESYYLANPDKYTERARVKVRHILSDTESEAAAVRRQLISGADFRALAKEKSKDRLSSRRDGLLGNIIENGYIPTIGKNPEILSILFDMDEKEISQPIESKKGHHVFLVENRTEARTKAMDEVHDLIVGELKREGLTNALESKLEELKAHYEVQIHDDAIESGSTPETGEFEFRLEDAEETTDGAEPNDLLSRAAGEDDPRLQLALYQDFVEKYPDAPGAHKAQFMIGFVMSEQLRDTVGAVAEFQKVLKHYPDSELAESARYMIEELAGRVTANSAAPVWRG